MNLHKITVTYWFPFEEGCDPAELCLAELGHEADTGDAISTDWTREIVSLEQAPIEVQSFFSTLEGEEDQ